jgi:DNA helicase-2/ATP-dependent DNA helicase PcrA
VADLGGVLLRAQREPGPEPVFAEAADEASEAAGVADWLVAQHRAGVPYREMAVLFRVNAQSPSFEQALADRDVPYLVRGGERFYERPEVRQALLTLRNQARVVETGSDGGPDGLQPAAAQVKALLGALGWTDQPPTGAGALRERWESLAALVAVAEDLTAARPGCTLTDVVVELQRRADAQHVPTANGVTVSTLHSAKGLEWDAVAVVGVSEGSLPFILASTDDQIEEERRLFYVGITRARSRLRISWSRTRNGSGQRSPSRFLAGVRPGGPADGGADRSRSTVRRSRPSALAAACRSCGRHLTDAAERKLGRHADCPASYDEPTLERLRSWRKAQADQERVPAYCIFTDATLVAIAESRPRTARELIKVPGVGKTKISQYGADVLEVVNDHG